jgi:hypothetical protein
MGTEVSSAETRTRASTLAETVYKSRLRGVRGFYCQISFLLGPLQIGSYHVNLNMDACVSGFSIHTMHNFHV